MLKKEITYEDFDGVQRTETHYFNITRTELIDLQTSYVGGLDEYLSKIVAEKDTVKIMEMFSKIVDVAYGIKSPDGRLFMKTEEATKEFKSTLAYDQFMWEIMSDEIKASEFINGIVPKVESLDTTQPQEEMS